MATGRANDLRAFRDFLDAKLSNGGSDLTPEELLELGNWALEAFRRDLPRLLEQAPGQWVAYCGDGRVALAPTKVSVYKECRRMGLSSDKILVRSIEPEGEETVFGPGLAGLEP